MNMPRMNRLCQILCAGYTFLAVSIANAEVKPTSAPEDQKPIWQWVAAIGIFVVCGAIMFKNSKRSHQD
ncbi:MAG: hypothetical protein DHS20C16_27890 [Phycisphaerae bacterium]|nr:MAG: hypothetical protein DHS20C16_27890 [Phycisphaerae bacterium]